MRKNEDMIKTYIDKSICDAILTVGCQYRPPKGGIAQVLSTYDDYVYEDFKICVNSGSGRTISKWMYSIYGCCYFLIKMFTDRQVRIVHIHTASYNSFWRSALYVRFARLFKKKVILHIHGGDFKNFYIESKEKVSAILDMCDCLITLSSSWKSYFESITKCRIITVIENVVAPASLFQQEHKDSKLHMLYLGLITSEKGIFDLVDVLERYKDEYQGKVVLHIGGNGRTEILCDRIVDGGLEDNIIYEGWVSGEKKKELLNNCDICILPSYAEGMPISLIEAMSYGQYVIASNVGGIPELVSSKVGELHNPGDVVELKRLIDIAIENQDCIRRRRQEIRSHVAKYSPVSVATKLNALYKQLLTD